MAEEQALSILIKFGLSDTAAKQAMAELQELNKETKSLSDVTKESSESQRNYASDLGQVEKNVEGTRGQTREMYRIFADLNRLAPGLGEALRASFEGPLGVLGLLLVSLVGAKEAFDAYDKKLEEVLGEDLTGGIDSAKLLATAYTGIADAVTKANQAFDDQASQRAISGISAQLNFTKQLIAAEEKLAEQRLKIDREQGNISEAEYQARLAALQGQSSSAVAVAEQKATQQELSQKNIDAQNARDEADAASKKAASFKLPASDEQAKAAADAVRKNSDDLKKSADDQAAAVAAQEDVAVTISQSPIWGLLVSLFTHPLVTLGGAATQGESITTPRDARASRAQSEAESREANSIEDQIKARDEARKTAEEKAAAAAKAQDEANYQNNPNNPGSLAARLAQEKALAAIGSTTSGESTLNADIGRIKSDLSVQGPGAVAAIRDAALAISEALSVMSSLAALGDDISKFRTQLSALQQQVNQHTYNSQ